MGELCHNVGECRGTWRFICGSLFQKRDKRIGHKNEIAKTFIFEYTNVSAICAFNIKCDIFCGRQLPFLCANVSNGYSGNCKEVANSAYYRKGFVRHRSFAVVGPCCIPDMGKHGSTYDAMNRLNIYLFLGKFSDHNGTERNMNFSST